MVRVSVLAPSLMSEPVPLELLSVPAKVIKPLVVPTVRVFAPKSTEDEDAPVSEATTWLAPRVRVELPLPVSSSTRSVRVPVGSAPRTLALSVAPLRRKVGPL